MLIKNNKVYDQLKRFAMITLPAVGTLYFGLAQVWGLPYGAEVTGSIVALDTFLGVTLHISNTQYENSDEKYDGAVNITPEEDNIHFQMDPQAVATKDEVRLKVNTVAKKPAKRTRAKKSTEGF